MEPAIYTSATDDESFRLVILPAASLTSLDRDQQQPLMYLSYLDAHGSRRRIRPLKVEIEPGTEGGFIAFAPAVSVGGGGRCAAEAIADLSDTLWSLWLDLSETPPGGLHDSARAFVEQLRSLLAGWVTLHGKEHGNP